MTVAPPPEVALDNVVLSMTGITKQYPGVAALTDVSFALRRAEVVALVGENGAGKSTLIKILSGAVKPDAGTISVDGHEVDLDKPADAAELGIATVYQEFSLFPELTVAENLFFGDICKRRGILRWKSLRRSAVEVLTDLGVQLDPSRLVRDLSIAEQQMLEIAKSLRGNARVIILDEPTAVLGGHDVDTLLDFVRSVRNRGVSVIFISHRLDEVFSVADSYVVLRDGRLTGAGRVADTDHDDLVTKMVGRAVLMQRPPQNHSAETGRSLLRVTDLERAGVFSDININLRAGEIVGMAGLRGAGRTEIARAIFGLDTATGGHIEVDGRRLPLGKPRASIAAGLGFVTEDRKAEGLYLSASVQRNIGIAKAANYKKRPVVLPRQERLDAAKQIRDLRIKVSHPGVAVGTLSGGNQQKVVIGRWLNIGAQILLLDEPTRGVDIGAKQEIYDLIRQLCSDGAAVLLISSELPELMHMADRILVMHRGAISAELRPEQTSEEEIAHYMVNTR